MTDQWTPWRSHTPGPCPVPVGTWMQVDYTDGHTDEGRLTEYLRNHPAWGSLARIKVTRYRIRIPPAMQLLNEALKVKEVEHA